MKFDRFMIAPLNSGLVNAVKPWLIPDDAFDDMNNVYPYRARIKKRFGSQWFDNSQGLTQLQQEIGTTIVGPDTISLPASAKIAIGQSFSVGTDWFTVYQLGANVATLSTNPSVSAVINSTSSPNTITFSGEAIGQSVFWYPANPVMGLITWEQGTVNFDQTIAFDTQYAYQYTAGSGWGRLSGEATAGASVWSGSDSQFFNGITWRGATGSERYLFVTNNNVPDGLRYYDGTVWHFFNPITLTASGNNLITAQLVVVFKNRLVYLSTTENVGGTQFTFVNRARYSVFGDPTATNAFNASIPGNGNAIDAATSEAIVTCGFIKDRLIVLFERSTWELAYTGNQIYPFVWQKLNNELGAESVNSSVPFDKVMLTVSAIGIHSCNGSNVSRIDDNIPLETFKISNSNNGPFRVSGIRDYFTEVVYWTFPNANHQNGYFPNQILVYNYKNASWSFFDDTITCFGYFQPQQGITWNSTTVSWDDEVPWDSGEDQFNFRQIIAGNQQGFIFVCNPDIARNSGNLQITNISATGNVVTLTVIDNNIDEGSYVLVENAINCNGSNCSTSNNNLNGVIFYVDSVSDDTVTLAFAPGFVYSGGSYAGAGTLATVSRIDMMTKQFNFYAKDGKNAFINKIDFLVDRVDNATISVDYYASSSNVGLVEAGLQTGSQLGTGALDLAPYVLIPQESTQERLWHPIYPNAEGEVIQLRIYYGDSQMLDPNTSLMPFQLHAFTMYATPVGRLQ